MTVADLVQDLNSLGADFRQCQVMVLDKVECLDHLKAIHVWPVESAGVFIVRGETMEDTRVAVISKPQSDLLLQSNLVQVKKE